MMWLLPTVVLAGVQCAAYPTSEIVSLCEEVLDLTATIEVVRNEETTRIEGIPLGDARYGAIEISNALIRGDAVLYELDSEGLRITGLRDFYIGVETDARSAVVDNEVLDTARAGLVRSGHAFSFSIANENGNAPMTWTLALSDDGHDYTLQTEGSDGLTLYGFAHSNHARVELRTDGGTSRAVYDDLTLVARPRRSGYLDLSYFPGTTDRAAGIFQDVVMHDGVDLGQHTHIDRRGNLTFHTAGSTLEGSLTLMLPQNSTNLRGLWAELGVSKTGIGFGLLPFSMLHVQSAGATYEPAGIDGDTNLQVPLSWVASLYHGTSSGWRYYLGSYGNLAYDNPWVDERSDGGLLGTALFKQTDNLNFGATLATDDVQTTLRLTLSSWF